MKKFKHLKTNKKNEKISYFSFLSSCNVTPPPNTVKLFPVINHFTIIFKMKFLMIYIVTHRPIRKSQ